jgi:hypothetical protein
MKLISILHFLTINDIIYKSPEVKSPEESHLESGGGGQGRFPPFLYNNIREFPIQKGTTGEMMWSTI